MDTVYGRSGDGMRGALRAVPRGAACLVPLVSPSVCVSYCAPCSRSHLVPQRVLHVLLPIAVVAAVPLPASAVLLHTTACRREARERNGQQPPMIDDTPYPLGAWSSTPDAEGPTKRGIRQAVWSLLTSSPPLRRPHSVRCCKLKTPAPQTHVARTEAHVLRLCVCVCVVWVIPQPGEGPRQRSRVRRGLPARGKARVPVSGQGKRR